MLDEKQEGQKTVVSFIVGLLIGGLLVWAFSGPEVKAPNDEEKDGEEMVDEEKDSKSDSKSDDGEMKGEKENETAPVAVLPVGDGKVVAENQAAGSVTKLTSAVFPISEGWIGVRDYQDGQLGGLLGVVRFSEEQGLVPSEVVLQRDTAAGKEYAVVVYTESGDRQFSLADDKQLDSVFDTFMAE